jgi:hypothetical protein
MSNLLLIDTVIRLRMVCNSMGLTLFRLGLQNFFPVFWTLLFNCLVLFCGNVIQVSFCPLGGLDISCMMVGFSLNFFMEYTYAGYNQHRVSSRILTLLIQLSQWYQYND